jgi:hypothetical protein
MGWIEFYATLQNTADFTISSPEVMFAIFGPKMAIAVARAISGAKKVSGPSKSLNFVPGPFRIPEMAPFSDFQG